jgi:hypothetical protein
MAIKLLLLRLLLYLLISGTFSLIIYLVLISIKNRRIKAINKILAKQENDLLLARETEEAEKILKKEEERCVSKLL